MGWNLCKAETVRRVSGGRATRAQAGDVRINTVQSMLLRQLRELGDQRRASRSGKNPTGNGGVKAPGSPMAAPRAVFARLRLLYRALNQWLTAWYELYGRAGMESPGRPAEHVRPPRARRAAKGVIVMEGK